MALPLPPSAPISDIVNGLNQMYAASSLPIVETQVVTQTYTYSATTAAYGVLLVTFPAQTIIQIPATVPIGTRLLIKDIRGTAGTFNIGIQALGGLLIDNSTANVVINVNWGTMLLVAAAEGLYTVGLHYVESPYMDSLIQFDNIIDSSITTGASSNAMSVGPITIANKDSNNNDVIVTIGATSRWVIV